MMKSPRLLACLSPFAMMALSFTGPSLRAQSPAPTNKAETSPSPTASLSSASPTQAQEKAAQLSAETWLMLLDDGKYAESWQTAAIPFQEAITQEKWITQLGMVRTAYGKASGRKLLVIKYFTAIPNAPKGEYVVMQYEATFENKKSAIETITALIEKDGTWKIAGYYIK